MVKDDSNKKNHREILVEQNKRLQSPDTEKHHRSFMFSVLER